MWFRSRAHGWPNGPGRVILWGESGLVRRDLGARWGWGVGADFRTGGFPKTVAIGGAPKRYKLVYKPHEYYRCITNKNHSYWSYKPTERYIYIRYITYKP